MPDPTGTLAWCENRNCGPASELLALLAHRLMAKGPPAAYFGDCRVIALCGHVHGLQVRFKGPWANALQRV